MFTGVPSLVTSTSWPSGDFRNSFGTRTILAFLVWTVLGVLVAFGRHFTVSEFTARSIFWLVFLCSRHMMGRESDDVEDADVLSVVAGRC